MEEMEAEVFARKRWDLEKMKAYGFHRAEKGYVLEKPFLEGKFKAVLSVDEGGHAKGKAIDLATLDEYYQLHQKAAEGAFVNQVREAYRALLRDIARSCCHEILFLSPQANRLAGQIQESCQITPDFPWAQNARNQTYGVFRHAASRKWFALIMDIRRELLDRDGNKAPIDIINLKIQPEQGEALRQHPSIYPSYHMNHKTWISVILDDSLSDERILALIKRSYQLTK